MPFEAEYRSVRGLPAVSTSSFNDMFGGGQIGIAHAQIDDVGDRELGPVP